VGDLDIQCLGGLCPVQGDGLVDGHRFYFRARGEGWTFDVWALGVGLTGDGLGPMFDLPEEDPVFSTGCPYKPDIPFEAGYMPDDEARVFIEESARKFVEWKAAHE